MVSMRIARTHASYHDYSVILSFFANKRVSQHFCESVCSLRHMRFFVCYWPYALFECKEWNIDLGSFCAPIRVIAFSLTSPFTACQVYNWYFGLWIGVVGFSLQFDFANCMWPRWHFIWRCRVSRAFLECLVYYVY